MVDPIQQQIVGGVAVNGGGGDQVGNGCGSGLQKIDAGRLLFPEPFFSLLSRRGGGGAHFPQRGFVIDAMHHAQHIESALRQPDMLGGMLVDKLVQQFQDGVVRVFRLQHRHAAAVQIPPGHLRLFIEQGCNGSGRIVRRLHAGVIGEGEEKAVGNGLPLHQLGHIGHTLLDHLPAPLVPLPLQRGAQHLHVAVQIKLLGEHVDLQVGRRDFQVGGQIRDGGAFFHFGHCVKVHRQQFHDFNKPLVPGKDHALQNILDRQPRLDTPGIGPAPVTDAGYAAAEDKFFQIHVRLPLLDKSSRACAGARSTKSVNSVSGCRPSGRSGQSPQQAPAKTATQ